MPACLKCSKGRVNNSLSSAKRHQLNSEHDGIIETSNSKQLQAENINTVEFHKMVCK